MKILKTATAGILLVLLVAVVLAVPQLPHQLYGSVTIGGSAAPDGIIISATCDGDTYQTTTSGGNFGYIPNTFFVEDPYGGRQGEDIEIYINNIKVDEIKFENAGLNELIIELVEFCGDGVCSGGETCSSCPVDCGVCDTGDGGGGNTGGGSSSSSSRTSSSVCVEKWQCSEWSDVSGACGTRTCSDIKKCGTTTLKPAKTRECEQETQETIIKTTTGQESSGITGAIVGVLGKGGTIGALIFIIAIIAIAIFVSIMRKKEKAKE